MKKFFAILAAIFVLTLPALALEIPEGAIMKTAGDPDVYVVKYLNGKSYKRLVLNPQIFESYRHLKWEDLVTVNQATINSFATSDLVRVDGTTEIYRLTPNGDNGSKVLVTDTESLDLNGVYTINNVDFENYTKANAAANLTGPYDIHKIIDGDTLIVSIDGTNKTVRLIGIDTPEIASSYTAAQCYGIQASQTAKDKLADKKIYLEADPVSGDKDKYGRLLRYVHLEDGTLFNKWMVEEGNAKEYTYAGIAYKYQSEFKTTQISAATARKGLWSVCRSK